MAFNLKNRHLLSLVNHSEREIKYLLDLSRDLKRAKYAGTEQQKLKGKNIALIFEKTSTRTRCAFEVAAYDQGAQVAEYAGVPVFNGLTDEFHPTQMLADVLTMIENCDKPLSEIKYVYIGDARNNMGNSLLLIGAKLGMDVRICGPKALLPDAELVDMCEKFAKQSGARITVTDDIDKAVKDVDFVHTDVWVSMGEPLETWGERIKLLLPYQVTPELMKRTGNPRVKFMHCLPAFHNSETKVGRQIAEKYPELANGIEVTEDVFESPMNVAFEQAENRMHTIKAVLYSSLI